MTWGEGVQDDIAKCHMVEGRGLKLVKKCHMCHILFQCHLKCLFLTNQAVNIRVLRLAVLLLFFVLDFGYWIYDKFHCDKSRVEDLNYCYTKVNYTAHFFGIVAGYIETDCRLFLEVLKIKIYKKNIENYQFWDQNQHN